MLMRLSGRASWLMLLSALLGALAIVLAIRWLARGEKSLNVQPEAVANASAIQRPELHRVPKEVNRPDAALRLALERLAKDDPPVGLALGIEEPDGIHSIVWGTVRDQDQAPIAEAYVSFTDRLGERIVGQTDTEGHYSVSGMRTGRWFVGASADGFLPVESWMQFDDRAPRVQLDFQLDRSVHLIVRVLTPDGRPFQEAAQEQQRGRWIPLIPVATDESPSVPLIHFGSWQERIGAGRLGNNVPAGPPGVVAEIELLEALPLYVSLLIGQQVLMTQVVSAGQDEIVFTLSVDEARRHLGEFVLTMVDSETGTPIAGSSVMAGQSSAVFGGKTTDATGRFELRGQTPGRYDFYIRAPDHASERLWIELPAGAKVERTLALSRTARIQGRVVNEAGQPWGAEIDLRPVPEPGECPAAAQEAFHVQRGTKGDTFDLKDVAPGRWLLQFHDAQRMSANVIVDTTSGPVTDLIVRVEPVGTLVATWMGHDREGIELRFLDASGLVRSRRVFSSPGPNRFTLPRGNWRMRTLDRQGAIVDEREVTLGAEPLVLELGR
jgi:Carboxypeptidase regulatory-like domain